MNGRFSRVNLGNILANFGVDAPGNATRKRWWGGPSRLITSRFAPKASASPPPEAKKKSLKKTSAPLVEALEPRLLLNADISPWLEPISDGLEEVSEFLEDIENSEALQVALPLLGDDMDGLLDLSDLVQETITEFEDILANIDDYESAETLAMMEDLEARLGATDSSYDVDTGISFTFDFSSAEEMNLPFDIAGTALDIDSIASANASFTIGIDFTATNPEDAFFVTFGDISLGIEASNDDVDMSVDVGGVSAEIIDGAFDVNLILGISLEDPSGDGKWTTAELDAVGTDGDLPGVTVDTDGSSLSANLPISFSAGSFESTNLGETILVADIENVFDLQEGDDIFKLEANLSVALQDDIVTALEAADTALGLALPDLNQMLEQEVPGMGLSFADLLSVPDGFEFSLGEVEDTANPGEFIPISLSTLALDYFTTAEDDGVEATIDGLMTALIDGLVAAGSQLIPTLDPDTLTISFGWSVAEEMSIAGSANFDTASLGIEGLTGSADLEDGVMNLVGGLEFALDLDAQDGVSFAMTEASLALEGDIEFSDISVDFAFASVVATVGGNGTVSLNSRLVANDSNLNGTIDVDELLSVTPEAELDVDFDFIADAGVDLGDFGVVADVTIAVNGSIDIDGVDVETDLSFDVDFTIEEGLQSTILGLMGDVDQYLSLADDQVENALGQLVPVINKTVAEILALDGDASLLPDISFENVATEYFDSGGTSMMGLIDAIRTAITDAGSAISVDFDPETLSLDVGLSIDSAVIIENQVLASGSLGLGDFGAAVAASGEFDLRGSIGIDLGLSMALMGEAGPMISITEFDIETDLEASIENLNATGDMGGIGGGIENGSASIYLTGHVAAVDGDDDGFLSVEELGQLDRDVVMALDAELPLITEGFDLLGEGGLIAPTVTLHSDNLLDGLSSDNITFFVDFVIGDELDVGISKVLGGIDSVLETALDGIAAVLDQSMPGMDGSIGDAIGLSADDVRDLDVDLAQIYIDLKNEKALAAAGDLPDGETVEVTIRELLAAMNDAIMAALAEATGSDAPAAIDGGEVSFLDGMFSVELDMEERTLVFNVNIEQALDTITLELDASELNADLGINIDTEITPTLGVTMSATMPLDDTLAVEVDTWSASIALNIDVQGEADGATAEITVGPFGVTIVDGELDLGFKVSGEALSGNEGEVSVEPTEPEPAEPIEMAGELAVGGLVSDDFADGDHVGTYGTLSIAGGEWSYALTATNIIGTQIDSFALTNVGGEDVTVPITVSGSNGIIFPTTNVSDLEVSDTAVIAIYQGIYGTLQVFAGTGGTRDISYQLNTSAINDAVADPTIGGSVQDTFEIVREDGSTEALVVKLSIPSDASTSFEAPEAHGFVDQTDEAKAYGTFSIAADGTWTYTVDFDNAAVAALTAGDAPLVDEVTVDRVDGTSETITITINGPDADTGGAEEETPEEASGQDMTFEASIDGELILNADIEGLGTAATLVFDINSDNLFGDTGVVSGDMTDLATYDNLAIDLTTLEFGYDIIIGSDLVDWVVDKLIDLDDILIDAMDDVDNVLDTVVPGIDKPLGEILGMEQDGNGNYSLDVPFSLTEIFQQYLAMVDGADDIEHPTIGGLFDYLKVEINRTFNFINIYYDPDDFAFDIDVQFGFGASLDSDWDMDLQSFAGDGLALFDNNLDASISGHVVADGSFVIDLGFGIDFVTEGDEPSVYFSEIAASADLNIDIDALTASLEVGPFNAGIENGTINITVEFDGEVVADENGDGVMSLTELAAHSALEFNLDASFGAVLPIDLSVGDLGAEVIDDIGSPIVYLDGEMNMTHDGDDDGTDFDLSYSMSYTLDLELGTSLQTVIGDVADALGGFIDGAISGVTDLLDQEVPGIGKTIGEILGIDVSNLSLDLGAIVDTYFTSATLEDPATLFGMLEDISMEIGKQVMPDLVGALDDYLAGIDGGSTTLSFEGLRDALLPHLGTGENVPLVLTALEEFFESDPTTITFDDVIQLLKPVLANVVSLIPNVDEEGQLKVDLSFNFGFGDSLDFDLSTDGLDIADVSFSVDGQGSLTADVELDFNVGLGLDLSDIGEGISAYLYLPDPLDPLAAITADAAITGLGFGVTVGGLEAGVVGGSAALHLELNLGLGADASLGDFDQIIFADTGSNVELNPVGTFDMTLPFQIGEDDGGGGTSFSLMSVTAEDTDLFTGGFNPVFDFVAFEMPSIIDILVDVELRDLLFTGVDMVLGGLEEFLQVQFLDRLANIPMLGDALKEDGNFVGLVREQFNLATDALEGQTGIDLADALATSLNTVFGNLGISNDLDENGDGIDDPIIWVNIKYRDSSGNEHVISMGGDVYKFDGVFYNNVPETDSGFDAATDFDFDALFSDDGLADNEFHAFEVQLDFHADLIAQLGLDALDEVALSFDLGLDFLTLNSDAVIDIELGLDINIALGISDDEGIYLGYDVDENELGLTLTAYLIGEGGDPAELTLELGFLGFSAVDNGIDEDGDGVADHGSGVSGSFGIDLIDPNNDGMIVWSELTGEADIIYISAELDVAGNIHLVTDMPAGIPQINVDFVYDQAISWSLAEGMEITPAHLQFNNLELDLGSFFSDILLPILSSVQDALDPLDPVIDMLLTPVPVLSDLAGQDLTMIDLAEIAIQASGKGKIDLSMIESALKIIQLILEVPTDSDSLIIDFGDFDLGLVGGDSSPSSTASIASAKAGNTSGGSVGDKSSGSSSSSSGAKADKATSFLDKLTGVEGLSIPLLSDPGSLLGLLMGETVDLIVYDMPGLEFNFEYRKDFLIVPQFMIWGGFFGEVNLEADLTFGYDSYGIQQFMDSGNALEIVNGLYIDDHWTVSGSGLVTDNPEVTFDVGIGVRGFGGLPGLVELGVYGGLFGHIELDLQDPGFTPEGDTGVPDGKLRIDEVINQLSLGPMCLFDITGSLEARLAAYFWLGVDLGFMGKVTLVDWEQTLFSITILEFDFDCTPEPPVFAQYQNSTGGATTWNGNAATYVTDDSGNYQYMVMEPSADGTLYLNIGDLAGDRLFGEMEADESMFLQQITIDGVDYIQVTLNGRPYSALDPNNDERMIKVLFRADDVTNIVANGGSGNDEILIDSSISSDITMTLSGGGGDDEIIALGGGDATIYGNGGNDLLVGGDAVHTIYGGDGDDLIEGGLGDDFLYGGDNDDSIMGGEGNDTIDGGNHNDSILGGIGDDTITGGEGNDRIRGEEGNDSIDGGGGDDTIFWMEGDGDDTSVLGGTGNDNLNILGSDLNDIMTLTANSGAVDFVTISEVATSAFTFDGIEGVTLDAMNGADSIEIFDLHSTDITGVIADVGQFTGTETHTIGMVETGEQSTDGTGALLFESDGVTPIMDKISIDFGVAGAASTLAAINAAEEEYGSVTGLTDRTIEASGLDGDADTIIIHGSDGAVNDSATITKSENVAQGVVLDVNLATDTSSYDVRVLNGERFFDYTDTLIIDMGDGDDTIDASDISDFLSGVGLSTGSADVIALDLRGGDGNDTLVGSAYADIMRGGLGDDTFTGGIGVDSFFDAGGSDTLIEQFDADMTIFNNAFVVGLLDGLTYGSTDLEGYFEEGVEFEKFHNNTLTGATDAYTAGAELELFADGLFEFAEITGDIGNNTLVVGDDNGTITIGDDEITGLNDWTGSVILDNVSNLGLDGLGLSPEYYVVRNSGGFTGTVEIRDSGEGFGTDELLIDLTQPEGLANSQDYNQTVTMSSDADPFDPYSGIALTNDTSGINGFVDVLQNGSDAAARIIYTDQVEKITIQTGDGDDVVTVNDALVRTAIELGDGDDVLTIGQVNTIVDSDGITVVEDYTPGNRDQMVVYGGDGDDIFNVHYHQATLSLYGENDDDLFAINSYLVSTVGSPIPASELNVSAGEGADTVSGPGNVNENNYDYLYNGELNIDGGAGFDTIALVGTDIGDEVVITDKFLAGMGHYIEHANIEGLAIYTLGGDDTIYVYSLPDTMTLTIKGGDGVDTINFGGNHEPIKMAPPVYDQPSAEIIEIIDGNGVATEILTVPDRVTQAPPQYWLWLGQDYDMSDIAGTVIIDGEGSDDIVNMFNGDNQVTDGRITSTQNEDEEWRLEVSGVATSSILINDVATLNLFLGGDNDTVTLDVSEGTPNVATTTVFTGGGDDTVYVDAIVETTNIFTGSGDDTVHVGDTVADKIGSTLTIDTDRDYAISTENVTGPDGEPVTAYVMQLTDGGIKLTQDVQLTNHTGWFVDPATGTAFYTPMPAGNFIQNDDGSWQYGTLDLQEGDWVLEPYDTTSPDVPSDLMAYNFKADGSHTFETTLTQTYTINVPHTYSGVHYYGWDWFNIWPVYWSYTVNVPTQVTVNSDLPKLLVEQAVTEATTVTYDTINDNVQVAGDDTVIIHDEGDGNDNQGTLTETALFGLDMGGHVDYTGVDTLTIDLGEGNDQFDVLGTNLTTVTNVNGHDGDDTIIVSGPAEGSVASGHIAPVTADEHSGSLDAIEGQLNIDAGADKNTLVVDDGGDGDADNNVVIGEDFITGLAPADITYTASDGSFESVVGEDGQDPEYRLRIYGGTGGNTMTVESTRGQTEEYTVINTGLGSDEVSVTETDMTHLIINAETGHDTIDASASDGDSYALHIYGNDGDDTLYGGASDDVIIGGLGDDTIRGNGGNDNIFGDLANINWNGLTVVSLLQVLTNDDGMDTISGGLGADTLRGQGNDDTIEGNEGDDLISGGTGDDNISGNAGNDIIFGDDALITWNGYTATDVVQVLTDDDGVDTISGGLGADTLRGQGNDDTIEGNDGADLISGGTGDDNISGNAGNDIIFGDDALITWNGLSAIGVVQVLTDDDGVDTISGGTGADTLRGQGNDDIIEGNDGDDLISGGTGNDLISGNAGNDIIFGDDALITWNGLSAIGVVQVLTDDDGMDTIFGGSGADIIRGQGNDDIIEGNDGDDLISGGSGNDIISGNADNDIIFGDTAVFGWSGLTLNTATELELGSDGLDYIEGNQGDDTIFGGGADDNIIGGSTVEGTADGSDSIDGGSGRDLIAGDNAIISNSAQAGLTSVDVRFRSLANIDGGMVYDDNGQPILSGSVHSDPAGANSRFVTLLDGAGNDVIAGGANDDWIFGQEGADHIEGDSALYANTVIDGVSEDDRAGVSGDGNDYIEGGAGADRIFGNLGQDDIIGGSSSNFGADSVAERADGADTIFGGSGLNSARYDVGNPDDHAEDADVIIGDNGSIFQLVDEGTGAPLTYEHDLSVGEMVSVRAVSFENYMVGGSVADIGGNDVIHGESGDDVIYGLTGDDVLYGDGQNDDIIGGMGEDKIFGGNGTDGIIGDDGQILTQLAGDGSTLFGLAPSATGQNYKINGDKLGFDGAAAGDLTKTAILYSTDVGDDDVIYGGLGDDFIHGGGGNDAMSGAEALADVFEASDAAMLSSPDYDPTTRTLSGYDANDPTAKIEGHVTNFEAYDDDGLFIDDGNDRLFGDDGHDWIVGGTGQDLLFGGRGDDVLNVDDDLDSLNSSGDDTGDLAGRDVAYGGEGLDVMIANSHDDQLIDWNGEFNSYIVPFKQFGPQTIIRMPSPSVIAYITALGGEAGMDTAYVEPFGAEADMDTDFVEPFGELGLYTQADEDAKTNRGAPRDPQPGNGKK